MYDNTVALSNLTILCLISLHSTSCMLGVVLVGGYRLTGGYRIIYDIFNHYLVTDLGNKLVKVRGHCSDSPKYKVLN